MLVERSRRFILSRTYQLGDVITHVDGSPFQPGVYKLIVAAAGYPTIEMPFEIRGVTHIFLPLATSR